MTGFGLQCYERYPLNLKSTLKLTYVSESRSGFGARDINKDEGNSKRASQRGGTSKDEGGA